MAPTGAGEIGAKGSGACPRIMSLGKEFMVRMFFDQLLELVVRCVQFLANVSALERLIFQPDLLVQFGSCPPRKAWGWHHGSFTRHPDLVPTKQHLLPLVHVGQNITNVAIAMWERKLGC